MRHQGRCLLSAIHFSIISYYQLLRGLAIAERPAGRSVSSVEIPAYCCANNANRSRPRFIQLYLHGFTYTYRCTRHNYRTASMQCRARDQQTVVQPIFWMSTRPYPWSTNVDYHQCCWWYRLLLRQHTVMDADNCGGWTQLFSDKAYEFQTVKVTFLPLQLSLEI